MQFKTYVQKNKPVYMYIHGECLSAFSFQEEIRELKKDYTLIVPVLDGHGSEAQKPFISIQQCAEELLTYLQEYYNGHIQVLSGFSLGAQIAVSMLSMKPDLCEYAMIESAMMQPVKLQSWSAYAASTQMHWQEKNGSINSCTTLYSMMILPLRIIIKIIRQ